MEDDEGTTKIWLTDRIPSFYYLFVSYLCSHLLIYRDSCRIICWYHSIASLCAVCGTHVFTTGRRRSVPPPSPSTLPLVCICVSVWTLNWTRISHVHYAHEIKNFCGQKSEETTRRRKSERGLFMGSEMCVRGCKSLGNANLYLCAQPPPLLLLPLPYHVSLENNTNAGWDRFPSCENINHRKVNSNRTYIRTFTQLA